MQGDGVFLALAGVSAAAAVVYGLFFLNRAPSWPRALVKTAFMAALAAAFISRGSHPFLIIALAASAAGDFFLAFDKKWVLPLGILSFLTAQLAYLVIFFFMWMFSGDNAPLWPRYAAMGLVIAAASACVLWLLPKLKWMALAVVPYAIAITGMGAMAMWLPWSGWPAMLGAALFLTSDFVLAAELFRLTPDAPARRYTVPIVWWTYVAAQALIVFGIVRVVSG